jgi:predicted nuclease with TOPRIM domain
MEGLKRLKETDAKREQELQDNIAQLSEERNAIEEIRRRWEEEVADIASDLMEVC